MKGLLSVIVTTFERPGHLRRALAGLRRQQGVNFEVIVADDGSGDETAQSIKAAANAAPYRIAHAWQENEGFRAARIRNLGIKEAHGDRVLFLDGDCVPLPGFLAVHAQALGTDAVLAGTRLFLDKEPSDTLTPESIEAGELAAQVPASQFRAVRWTATKNLVYRHVLRKDRPKVVTANLSVSRSSLDAVNGLDERFVGWGCEDDDLRRRLLRSGYPLTSVFTRARVCHLWHEPVESFPGRVRDTANIDYFKRGFYLSRCRIGLRRRPIEGCTVAWNGEQLGQDPVEVSIAWGHRPRWREAQVRVFVAMPGVPTAGGKAPHILVARSDDEANSVPGGVQAVRLPAPADPSTPVGRATILTALDPIL